MAQRRLTGRQIVAVVVAICTASVLVPAGVYAASSLQKVKLVDAKHPARVARVSSSGRVEADVKGSVTANVHGSVTAAPALPGTAFSVAVSADETLQDAVPAFTKGALLITSFTFSQDNGATAYAWIYHYADAACTTQVGYYLYESTLPGTTASASFPTPVIIKAPCALLHVGGFGVATITGYRVG